MPDQNTNEQLVSNVVFRRVHNSWIPEEKGLDLYKTMSLITGYPQIDLADKIIKSVDIAPSLLFSRAVRRAVFSGKMEDQIAEKLLTPELKPVIEALGKLAIELEPSNSSLKEMGTAKAGLLILATTEKYVSDNAPLLAKVISQTSKLLRNNWKPKEPAQLLQSELNFGSPFRIEETDRGHHLGWGDARSNSSYYSYSEVDITKKKPLEVSTAFSTATLLCMCTKIGYDKSLNRYQSKARQLALVLKESELKDNPLDVTQKALELTSTFHKNPELELTYPVLRGYLFQKDGFNDYLELQNNRYIEQVKSVRTPYDHNWNNVHTLILHQDRIHHLLGDRGLNQSPLPDYRGDVHPLSALVSFSLDKTLGDTWFFKLPDDQRNSIHALFVKTTLEANELLLSPEVIKANAQIALKHKNIFKDYRKNLPKIIKSVDELTSGRFSDLLRQHYQEANKILDQVQDYSRSKSTKR